MSAKRSKSSRTSGWRRSSSRMPLTKRQVWQHHRWLTNRSWQPILKRWVLCIRAGSRRFSRQRSLSRYCLRLGRRRLKRWITTRTPRQRRSSKTFNRCWRWWMLIVNCRRPRFQEKKRSNRTDYDLRRIKIKKLKEFSIFNERKGRFAAVSKALLVLCIIGFIL